MELLFAVLTGPEGAIATLGLSVLIGLAVFGSRT